MNRFFPGMLLLAVCMWAASSQPPATITVHPNEALGTIDPRIFGQFTEPTLTSFEGAVLSEMLFNRKFEIPEERGPGHFDSVGTASGWEPVQFDASASFLVDRRIYYSSSQSERITKTGEGGIPAGIQQTGYRYVLPQSGIHQKVADPFEFKPGQKYRIRLAIKNKNLRGNVIVALGDSWRDPVAKQEFSLQGGEDWKVYHCELTPAREAAKGKFMVYLNSPGTIWVDSVPMVRVDLDEDGFRKDVVEITRRIKPTSIRWGGWFFSDYDWRNGIGPVDQRPAELNRSWLGYWDNDVGIDEFVALCRKLHAEPYPTVNVGSGTPEEAAAMVEYANGSPETKWGKIRARNGHPEPYRIRDWSLGNEEYLQTVGGGPGALYGERSIAFAKAMRAVDPSIRLVGVGIFDVAGGPSASQHPFYKYVRFIFDWNRQVLPGAGQVMDYYSIHHYDPSDSVRGMTTREIDQAAMVSAEDLSAKLDDLHKQMDQYAPGGKRFPIAMDEWAVWLAQPSDAKPPNPDDAKKAPLLGLQGSLTSLRDALAEASVYNLMQRRPKDFAMAHQTFLYVYSGGVVGIGRDRVAISATGLMLEMFSTYDQCQSVRTEVQGPTFNFPRRGGIAGDYRGAQNASYLDVSARLRPDGKTLEIFVVNRDLQNDIEADVHVAGTQVHGPVSVATLNADSLTDWNSLDKPDRVRVTRTQLQVEGERFKHRFPAHSITA
ncbi:MAG: alpha-L-arabinofuranosidase C-terminal domain-containing protein, partial [Blastocatellia bacterium]